MKILKRLIVCFSLLLTTGVFALEETNVSIDFNSPQKFTDFKSEIIFKNNDNEKLMKQLSQLMTRSIVKKIPDNYSMQITVNNIDMAGTFLYGNSDLIRIVKETDRIRIEFSYRLLDANGQLIKHEDVNLSSMNPMRFKYQSKNYKGSYFSYEMPLFNNWLKKLL